MRPPSGQRAKRHTTIGNMHIERRCRSCDATQADSNGHFSAVALPCSHLHGSLGGMSGSSFKASAYQNCSWLESFHSGGGRASASFSAERANGRTHRSCQSILRHTGVLLKQTDKPTHGITSIQYIAAWLRPSGPHPGTGATGPPVFAARVVLGSSGCGCGRPGRLAWPDRSPCYLGGYQLPPRVALAFGCRGTAAQSAARRHAQYPHRARRSSA